MTKTESKRLVEEFDRDLWSQGVESEAFWPELEPTTKHYVLYAGDRKVGLASATPFSGDRFELAYHVDSDERGKGYGTEIIRRMCEVYPKAIFTIKRSNAPSQGALASALRGKDYRVTSGKHVLRIQTDPMEKKSAFMQGFLDELDSTR